MRYDTITSQKGSFEVAVLMDGQAQPLRYRPDGRMFVAGEPGQAVSIRVTNRASARIETVVSLDGRSILQDEPASVSSPGLVIAQGATYTFRGWRLDDDRSREIVLGSVAESVASQSGDSSSVGVIGIACWLEQRRFATRSVPFEIRERLGRGVYGQSAAAGSATMDAYMLSARNESAPVGMAGAASASPGKTWQPEPPAQQVGMGIGEEQEDRVGQTHFTRLLGSLDHVTIGYDTAASLDARGIIRYDSDPQPFPADITGYQEYRSVRG